MESVELKGIKSRETRGFRKKEVNLQAKDSIA